MSTPVTPSNPQVSRKRQAEGDTPSTVKKRKSGTEANGEVAGLFEVSTHWSDHAIVRHYTEIGLREMALQKVVVVHILSMSGADAKVGGQKTKCDLWLQVGFASFLEQELKLDGALIESLPNCAKDGAKWLVVVPGGHSEVGGPGREV